MVLRQTLIFLPEISLAITILSIYFQLWAYTHLNIKEISKKKLHYLRSFSTRGRHQSLDTDSQSWSQHGCDNNNDRDNFQSKEDEFEIDGEDLQKLIYRSQNQCKPLLWILFPGLMSMVFCTLLLIYEPEFEHVMWPEGFPALGINGSLNTYLVPVSLLYALLFTLSFEFVVEKQVVVRTHLTKELNLLYELMNLLQNFSSENQTQAIKIRLQIANQLHLQVLDIVKQIRGGQNAANPLIEKHLKTVGLKVDNEAGTTTVVDSTQAESAINSNLFHSQKLNKDYARKLWTILPLLRKLIEMGQVDNINSILISKVMDTIMNFAEAVTQRRAVAQQRLNIQQWFFLEFLSFITFIAVILIKAESVEFEVMMHIMTAFSITLLNLILADADDVFHGYFRFNTSGLLELVKQTAYEIQSLRATLMSEPLSEKKYIKILRKDNKDVSMAIFAQ